MKTKIVEVDFDLCDNPGTQRSFIYFELENQTRLILLGVPGAPFFSLNDSYLKITTSEFYLNITKKEIQLINPVILNSNSIQIAEGIILELDPIGVHLLQEIFEALHSSIDYCYCYLVDFETYYDEIGQVAEYTLENRGFEFCRNFLIEQRKSELQS